MAYTKGNNSKETVRKYFDDVSDDYSKYKYGDNKRSYMSVRQEYMLDYLNRSDINVSANVLDAGCGSGQYLAQLIMRGFKPVGMDMSSEMLGLTRENIKNETGREMTNLITADIENIPFKDNIFDIVSTAGVIEYLNDDNKVLSEFKRILKDNGLLVISITNKYSYNLMFDNIYEYFRGKKLFFKIMNFVSKNILGHGELQPKKFIIRRHVPSEFRMELDKNGFDIIYSRYFYYTLLPHPFNALLFKFGDWVGKKLELLGKTKLAYLGEGFLVVCRNKK